MTRHPLDVWVVDDDQSVRWVLEKALKAYEAERPAEALTLARAAARGIIVADGDPAWLELLADCRRELAVPDFRTFMGLDA